MSMTLNQSIDRCTTIHLGWRAMIEQGETPWGATRRAAEALGISPAAVIAAVRLARAWGVR